MSHNTETYRCVLKDIRDRLNQQDAEKSSQQQLRVLLCEIVDKATAALEKLEWELDLQRQSNRKL